MSQPPCSKHPLFSLSAFPEDSCNATRCLPEDSEVVREPPPLCCSGHFLGGKNNRVAFLFCRVRNCIPALKPVVMFCVVLGTLTEVRSV